MAAEIAHQVAHLARRAAVAALVCLAFALGSGAGAFFASAQDARGEEERTVLDGPPLELDEAFATVAARGPELPALEVAHVVASAPTLEEPDIHTVARALSVQPPSVTATPPPLARPLIVPPPPAPPVPPASPLAAGTLVQGQVTFYYCSGGFVGDGGGFCGHTADGTPVHIGVAACDRAYMGQVFRVVGDPSGLVFRCADTGGAVRGQIRDMWFPTPASGGAWLAGVGYNVTFEILP